MENLHRNNPARILIFTFFVLVSCRVFQLANVEPTQIPTPSDRTEEPLSALEKPTFEVVTEIIPTKTVSALSVEGDYILSIDAGNFVGETVAVRIEKANCSYRPDVNGAPTFCNDQPFPNHSFALIVWGKDWTDFDGECIDVTGEIEEYEGKYEIIANSLDQVNPCK